MIHSVNIRQLGGHKRKRQRHGRLALIDTYHRMTLFMQAVSYSVADQTVGAGNQYSISFHVFP
jgi:hypothetical protein